MNPDLILNCGGAGKKTLLPQSRTCKLDSWDYDIIRPTEWAVGSGNHEQPLGSGSKKNPHEDKAVTNPATHSSSLHWGESCPRGALESHTEQQ